MVPDMEKPRVTEFQVRIDCNGCVQKIKKALSSINGIQDIYIDIPQQKLTIIGWADLGKIAKALKKTRKLATICPETEPFLPVQPQNKNEAPHVDPSNPPTTEPVSPVEPQTEPHNPPPKPEPTPPPPPKEAEVAHVVHRNTQDSSHRFNQEQVIYNATVEHYTSSPHPQYKHEPRQPIRVNHSYNTYKPTPYVTEYQYAQPPPQYSQPEPPQEYTHYNRPEPPQRFTHYNRPEPPPPQQTHYTRPKPPQHYNRPKPKSDHEYTHYNNISEPPRQYTRYNRPEPPEPYTNYARSEPQPQLYANYGSSEPPPQQYANYARPMPAPQYTHYGGEYYSSSNGNGNITSIFSDDNPNACTIV